MSITAGKYLNKKVAEHDAVWIDSVVERKKSLLDARERKKKTRELPGTWTRDFDKTRSGLATREQRHIIDSSWLDGC